MLTLYRNQSAVELRAHQPDGSFDGRATATLSDPTNDEVTERISALTSGAQGLGELPSGVPTDLPVIELWLPGLSISYSTGYPPTGVVELDETLAAILDDLSHCRSSERMTVDADCEQLAYVPD
ncbi:hypothetical protein [Enhygromyxa salina]|uniref:hypothetical protein n=1 Tax=Enhygromyxa salina TaxID=215803 RepID=UPI000D09778A|nr:hypothetical protein [Enhygromyxa salina]